MAVGQVHPPGLGLFCALLLASCTVPGEPGPSPVREIPLTPAMVVGRDRMRWADDGALVLDHLVLAEDRFEWSDPGDSEFDWSVLQVGEGTLSTRSDGARGALLDVSNPGDAVQIESGWSLDVQQTPRVSLEVVGRSLDDRDATNDNTQEFFFKTGRWEQWSEFVMFDMGGASPNPSNPDRDCDSDEGTPYNRDQLSTRSRVLGLQCWDGFSNAPADWSSGFASLLTVDFQIGTAQAFVDGVRVASLDSAMGQTIRNLEDPKVWLKNVEKGGGEDLIIESIILRDLDSHESSGAVTVRLDVSDADCTTASVRPMGDLPEDSDLRIEVAETADGSFEPLHRAGNLSGGVFELFVRIQVAAPRSPESLALRGLTVRCLR